MPSYLLAIDQGTTSSRAIIFDTAGTPVCVRQKELTLHYPEKGWVEQDPEDIWADTLWAIEGVVAEVGADSVAAAGITNQRETTVIWDRETGKPIYNAIVWQDRRTTAFCATLKDKGHEVDITAKTGLLLDPYFSASKIAWILDHVDGARKRAEAGELAFGTVDTFLLWRLTGEKSHYTDVTNASRTMLYNIVTQEWDEDLLKLFNIPRSLLPEVLDNVADFGEVVGQGIPIGGMAGDQQAALIGQACFEPGMVKSTYGTGCFALMNLGAGFKLSQNRLLTTAAYRINDEMIYALEGSIFTAGAAIQWLRDNLGLFADAGESEALARSVDDNNEVYFVPAFTGLGAPYWKPEARAAVVGLSRESNAAHITRAALEAQGYQSRDLFEAMQGDSGLTPDLIRADGGLTHNGFMCQFLADMLDCTVEIPSNAEATAWGAAALAGLYAEIFPDFNAISTLWSREKQYQPAITPKTREALYMGWKFAIERIIQENP